MMELYYEGVDITQDIEIKSATMRDVASGKNDCLDIVFSNSRAWYYWQPNADDRIEIRHNGYATGIMFINAVAPEGKDFRILATAAKSGARQKRNISFSGIALKDILQNCGAECGMGYKTFGVDENTVYPYLQRYDETPAAFLQRIADWEGAVLKTYSGKFTMIGIVAAQQINAVETITINADTEGIQYRRFENTKIKSLTVVTPYARVTASDKAVLNGREKTVCLLPAKDAVTAGKWARGMLLGINRKAEELVVDTVFHAQWSAMIRVDVEGNTDANGQWVIDEVEHDFINNTSRATLLRCVETVI